jgi:DNA-binding NarL/FixJ family response regulator
MRVVKNDYLKNEFPLMTELSNTAYIGRMLIKVFIFEDHWMYREALVSVLGRQQGLEILGAEEDVKAGLDKAFKLKPDVIIMDIRFKGEDSGIEATAELQKILPETKVIIFSEHPDEEHILVASDAGAVGYILKNDVQDADIIINAINTVYQGGEYFTPSIKEKLKNRILGKRKFGLSKREIEVLKAIAKGLSNRMIAGELFIDERTVANHVSNILFKLNAKNRTEAAAICRGEGIID